MSTFPDNITCCILPANKKNEHMYMISYIAQKNKNVTFLYL